MNNPAKARAAVVAAAPSGSSAQDVLQLTIAANQVASNYPEANSYEERNAILIQEEKARVQYKNGYTVPVSAKTLLANAMRRDYNHRRRLASSIEAATNQKRPSGACAHHIVAHREQGAFPSRMLMFNWGIGINDADNGVFLPGNNAVRIPGHPSAAVHTPHHDPQYHIMVFARLRLGKNADQGRGALRSVKAGLLAGTFPL